MSTSNLVAPNAFQTITARDGTAYTSDVNRIITVPTAHIPDFLAAGCVYTTQSVAIPEKLKLLNFKNLDGSTLAAAASSGKFGIAATLGTSFALASESANNNTKTDTCITEYVLPADYVAGTNITCTVHASITGSGTLTTKTAQIKAYKTANDGTQGSDIGPAAATAITAAGADIPFTITGTGLNPGDKLVLALVTILTETASSGMVANINSIRIA
jgi:hypothetical protein